MVHSYLRYEKLRSVGGIYGGNGNVAVFDENLVLSPVNEEVILWNVKTNAVVSLDL